LSTLRNSKYSPDSSKEACRKLKVGREPVEEGPDQVNDQGSDQTRSGPDQNSLQKLTEAAVVDCSSNIYFNKFVSATVHKNKRHKEDRLFAAFQYFNTDNGGFITIHDVSRRSSAR
jgi:hypothetical protein